MNRQIQRRVLLALAIVLALLPFVELVDHWESFGSDPEFVSVCTVLGVACGILIVIRNAILACLRRLLPIRFALRQGLMLATISSGVIQAILPRIRTPIRI